MKILKVLKILLFAGTVIQLMAGIVHFFMPVQVLHIKEFTLLAPENSDMIILLINAVGLCIVSISILSCYFTFIFGKYKFTYFFFTVQGVLWMFRALFEILWPVRITFFGIQKPTFFILWGAIILSLCFLIPQLFYLSINKELQHHEK
jgi:hypothetical protein